MEPIVVWIAVVASAFVFVVCKILMASAAHRRHQPFVSLGSEREELFVPGDRLRLDEHDTDCYDED